MQDRTCKRCGKIFTVDETIETRKQLTCNDCLAEINKARYAKASESHKARWANLDDKAIITICENIKNGIANMDEDAKIRRSVNSSKAAIKQMASMTEEQKKQMAEKISAWNRKRWESMTEEEKKEYSHKISIGQASMNSIKKEAVNLMRSKSLKLTLANMSEEQKAARRQRVQDWWDNMTPEEFNKWNAKRAARYGAYVLSLNITPNKLEGKFIDMMNNDNLKFIFQSFNTTAYPDFEKLFPINPITGSSFVSPYHKWDFKVTTFHQDILIDVDGSIHFQPSYVVTNKNGKEFNLLEYHQFHDSLRKYQTDGLDAYVILSKDDELNNTTPVLNVKTEEQINLMQLLSILRFSNMTDNEQYEIIKGNKLKD